MVGGLKDMSEGRKITERHKKKYNNLSCQGSKVEGSGRGGGGVVTVMQERLAGIAFSVSACCLSVSIYPSFYFIRICLSQLKW